MKTIKKINSDYRIVAMKQFFVFGNTKVYYQKKYFYLFGLIGVWVSIASTGYRPEVPADEYEWFFEFTTP